MFGSHQRGFESHSLRSRLPVKYRCTRGGARVAEWARLLSECRGNSVAGSNPALPARNENALRQRVLFFIRLTLLCQFYGIESVLVTEIVIGFVMRSVTLYAPQGNLPWKLPARPLAPPVLKTARPPGTVVLTGPLMSQS